MCYGLRLLIASESILSLLTFVTDSLPNDEIIVRINLLLDI